MADSILDYTGVTRDHWETIQQWRIDEGKNYARTRSDAITRMAAGGMATESDQWNTNLAKIDKRHGKEMKRIESSATMGILDNWVKEMKDFYIEATKTDVKARGDNTPPRQESAPSGGPKDRDPGFSYEAEYQKWQDMTSKERLENNMVEPPPRSYEEAVDQAVEAGEVKRVPTSEARQLERSGQDNPYNPKKMSEQDFRELSTEEFMELQFGYTKKYKEANDFSGEQAQADRKDQRRRGRINSRAQTSMENPWWG